VRKCSRAVCTTWMADDAAFTTREQTHFNAMMAMVMKHMVVRIMSRKAGGHLCWILVQCMINVCMFLCMYVWMSAYVFSLFSLSLSLSFSLSLYIYIYIYIYMHMYIYIYIHTCIHTYIQLGRGC
jgi:hypothetical protein